MTVRDLRRAAVAALIPLYGRGEAEWMTRLTLESVTGWSRVDLLAPGNARRRYYGDAEHADEPQEHRAIER